MWLTKSFRVCLVLWAASLVIATCAHGQQTLPELLSLEDAVRLALARNPLVQAGHNEVEIAAALRRMAGRRLNPAFTFNLENARPFSTNQGPFFRTTDQYALFSYEIETGSQREWRTRAASWAEEASQAALEDRRRLLTLEVYRAYFLAVRAQSDLNVAEDILGKVDRIAALNRVRYDKGEISGGELKRVELERLRFLDDLFAARLELRNAKSELLTLLHMPNLEQEFRLADPLKVVPNTLAWLPDLSLPSALEELRQRAMRQRPDLRAALREEQRADTETRHQRAIRSPNLTVVGGLKRTEGFQTLSVGVTVPLKIFNRNQDGLAQAEAELARARNLAAATRSALLLEIQKAYNAVQVNRERVQYIEQDFLEKSEQSRQILTASYQMGESDLIDLLDAERIYRETRRIHNQALYNYRISLCELAAAVGEELTQ